VALFPASPSGAGFAAGPDTIPYPVVYHAHGKRMNPVSPAPPADPPLPHHPPHPPAQPGGHQARGQACVIVVIGGVGIGL